jgi:uncharacterized membrane protein YoaK (UPF0700 family)
VWPGTGTLTRTTQSLGEHAHGWVIRGLCLLTKATGALDARSFLDLGRTFTANMTGSLLLVALSPTYTSHGRGSRSRGFAGALFAFVLGALLGAAPARRRGCSGRRIDIVASIFPGAVAGAELQRQAAMWSLTLSWRWAGWPAPAD